MQVPLQDTLLHQCDLCRQRTKQAYRCALCDFDVCPACFNKKDKSAGEGQLRGDKGVRNVETIGAGAYFARGLKLVAPHLPLFGVALLCLCANSLINLFMPNFQGRIIDAVIAGHTACATNATAFAAADATAGSTATPSAVAAAIATTDSAAVATTVAAAIAATLAAAIATAVTTSTTSSAIATASDSSSSAPTTGVAIAEPPDACAAAVTSAAIASTISSAAEPASAAPAARIASEAQACRLSSRSETSICALALLH